MAIMQFILNTPADIEAKAEKDLTRARRKLATVNGNDDWRTAIGAMEDTLESREAWDLCEQWRRSVTDP
jgi:hypothetical protein